MNQMWKRMGALVMCTGLAVSTAACGGGNSSSGTTSSDSGTASAADSGEASADNSGGETFDEEPYEIVIENMTLGQTMNDLDAVAEAVSEITLPAINCTVKIVNIHIADHATRMSLMAAGGEKMDLITTGRTVPLSQLVSDGVIIPIDDLLEQYGPTLVEKTAKIIDGNKINGEIYSVPADLYPGSDLGFVYNADLAEELDIEIPENPTWDFLTEIAPVLKERGVYLTSQRQGAASSQMLNIMYPQITNMFGTNYMYGVIDDVDNNTKIINLFDTDYYLNYCLEMRKWCENGWIPEDSIVNGQDNAVLLNAGQAFLTWTGVNPSEKALQTNTYAFKIGMFSMAETQITTDRVQEVGWGIPITCERPDKAMEFLNFMYENADVANLLMNGLEGKEYEKVSEHIITYPEGVDASNIGYSRNFSIFGDTMMTYQWAPTTEDFYQELQEYYNSKEVSPLFGYSFDASPVSTQVSAVSNVIAEYMPSLECGVVEDVEASVEEFRAALNSAGIDKIIAENQRQLDEWLAANQ